MGKIREGLSQRSIWMRIRDSLRRKKKAFLRAPRKYAVHYTVQTLLRAILWTAEFILLRAAAVFPARLPDWSTRDIVQGLRRIDDGVWRLIREGVSGLADLGNWVRRLSGAPMPEVLRQLNGHLSGWIQRRWATLRRLWDKVRTPRQILHRAADYIRTHARRIRRLRRGAVSVVFGLVLTKIMTVLLAAVAGTAAFFSVFGINCMIFAAAAVNFAATKIAYPLARIADRCITRMRLDAVLPLGRYRRLLLQEKTPQKK